METGRKRIVSFVNCRLIYGEREMGLTLEIIFGGTYQVRDATVRSRIPRMQQDHFRVHPTAIGQTKILPRHSNKPVWRWGLKIKATFYTHTFYS
jgi:hypothetical protein